VITPSNWSRIKSQKHSKWK